VYLLTVAGLIACKDARLFESLLIPMAPISDLLQTAGNFIFRIPDPTVM
jgi:hypothetical protein